MTRYAAGCETICAYGNKKHITIRPFVARMWRLRLKRETVAINGSYFWKSREISFFLFFFKDLASSELNGRTVWSVLKDRWTWCCCCRYTDMTYPLLQGKSRGYSENERFLLRKSVRRLRTNSYAKVWKRGRGEGSPQVLQYLITSALSVLLITGRPEDSGCPRRESGPDDLLASCYADLRVTNGTL